MGGRRTGSPSGMAQAGLTQPPSGSVVAGIGAEGGGALAEAAADAILGALCGSGATLGEAAAEEGASPGKNSNSGFSAELELSGGAGSLDLT